MVAAAFNALLTSLDAKLPTSRFTADELGISNGRARTTGYIRCITRCSSILVATAVVVVVIGEGGGKGRDERPFPEPAYVRIFFPMKLRRSSRPSGNERWFKLTVATAHNETRLSCHEHLVIRYDATGTVPRGWHDISRVVFVAFYCAARWNITGSYVILPLPYRRYRVPSMSA